jgi:hypothetical protein
VCSSDLETLDEAYETYGDSVEILERKIQEMENRVFDIGEIYKNRENYLAACEKDPVLRKFVDCLL